jgi:phosphatidylserine/phosphatidylglycerophosphate/cardiolipin synthase-like enzyme
MARRAGGTPGFSLIHVKEDVMTTYIDPIRTMLEQNYPQPNPLWNYSTDNQLADGWLLATPSNVWGLPYTQFKQAVPGSGPLKLQTCTAAAGPTQLCQAMDASMTAPGQAPQKLLIGHSDAIVDAMYDVMISARVLLDITTLSPPTGRFLESLKNALKYLSNQPDEDRPVVRILVSNPLPNIPPVTADPFIRSLTSELDASKGLQVYVYVMSSSFTSWNHAKIVAADGVRAVVGGHNQFSRDYLGVNPVNDVSMRLTGTAARHAQDFANSMWVYGQWVRDGVPQWDRDWNLYIQLYMSAYKPASANGPSQIQPGQLPAKTLYNNRAVNFPTLRDHGSVPILAVGRGADTKSAYLVPTPGSYKRLFNEPADEAIVKLISLAQRTIRMSLQSFQLSGGWVARWNPEVLGAMAEALSRGVTIRVVTSNPGAVAGGDGDNYGADPPSTVNAEIVSTMVERLGLLQDQAEQIASQRLSIATFRYSADPAYPGNVPISNHAKTVIVDDAAFYIGSQNMYTCDLNEFGYIVEDAATAQAYVNLYWNPLWNWSKGTATTSIDPDVATSHQIDAMQFIMALPLDTLLNMQWTTLLNQYNAATDPTMKAAIEESMNQLITTANFDTTAATVLAGLDQPFFTDTPLSTAATAEALRFVANFMNSRQLMAAFNQVVMAPYDSVADANAAISKFLTANGYSCNVYQVVTAFAEIQKKTLAYWTGTYTIWLTDDGGTTYASASNPAAQPHALQARAATDTTTVPTLGPSLVVTATGVTYDGVAIANPTYNNNALTWSSSDGNPTSASIRFGTVTRATLNDSFVGSECFGSITYPSAGSSGYQGTYSLYGRVDTTPGGGGTDPVDRGSYTLFAVLGVLGLAALIAMLGFFAFRSAPRQAQRMRDAQAKKNDGDGGFPGDQGDAVVSPGRRSESSRIKLRMQQDEVESLTAEMRRLTIEEPIMTVTQRNKLSSAATEVRTVRTQLQDPPAAALPDVVGAMGTRIDGVIASIKSLISADNAKFSASTRDALTKSGRYQDEIREAFDAVDEQLDNDKPFEFELTELEGY